MSDIPLRTRGTVVTNQSIGLMEVPLGSQVITDTKLVSIFGRKIKQGTLRRSLPSERRPLGGGEQHPQTPPGSLAPRQVPERALPPRCSLGDQPKLPAPRRWALALRSIRKVYRITDTKRCSHQPDVPTPFSNRLVS